MIIAIYPLITDLGLSTLFRPRACCSNGSDLVNVPDLPHLTIHAELARHGLVMLHYIFGTAELSQVTFKEVDVSQEINIIVIWLPK